VGQIVADRMFACGGSSAVACVAHGSRVSPTAGLVACGDRVRARSHRFPRGVERSRQGRRLVSSPSICEALADSEEQGHFESVHRPSAACGVLPKEANLNHTTIGTDTSAPSDPEASASHEAWKPRISLRVPSMRVDQPWSAASRAGHIPVLPPRSIRCPELSLLRRCSLPHYIGKTGTSCSAIRECEGVRGPVLVKLGADLNLFRSRSTAVVRSATNGKDRPRGHVAAASAAHPRAACRFNSAATLRRRPLRESSIRPSAGRRKSSGHQVFCPRGPAQPVLIGDPGAVGQDRRRRGFSRSTSSGRGARDAQGQQLYTLDLGALVAARR